MNTGLNSIDKVMPTIVTHAAVPLCLGLGLGARVIPPRLLLAGIIYAVMPDLDVLSFKLGVAYADAFGHRGFTHSLLFALILPTLALCARSWFGTSYIRLWLFLFISSLSHSMLDALTTGGMGVGWLWPWSQTRFFFPAQVIRVAPFQLTEYLTPRGFAVMRSELFWVWLPGAAMAFGLYLRRIIQIKNKVRLRASIQK